MQGAPKPTPEQQLPPLEYIVALIERLKLFKKNPIATLALAEAKTAERIYRRDIKLIVDGGNAKGE